LAGQDFGQLTISAKIIFPSKPLAKNYLGGPPKIEQIQFPGEQRFPLDAASKKQERSDRKRECLGNGKWQHRLRVVWTHDQGRERRQPRTCHLQHLLNV